MRVRITIVSALAALASGLGSWGSAGAPLPSGHNHGLFAPTTPFATGEIVMANARQNKLALTRGRWRITQINEAHLPEDTALSLQFEGPSARFFGGCNDIQTTALFGAHSFRFEQAISTKKHCPEPVMAQEAALMAAIEAVDLLTIPGPGVLAFYDRNNALVLAAVRDEG